MHKRKKYIRHNVKIKPVSNSNSVYNLFKLCVYTKKMFLFFNAESLDIGELSSWVTFASWLHNDLHLINRHQNECLFTLFFFYLLFKSTLALAYAKKKLNLMQRHIKFNSFVFYHKFSRKSTQIMSYFKLQQRTLYSLYFVHSAFDFLIKRSL